MQVVVDGGDDDDDDQSAGWTVCATVYGINPGDTANYTQLAQEDRGTCRSYMNDECREAIREAAADWRADRFAHVPGDPEFIPLPDQPLTVSYP